MDDRTPDKISFKIPSIPVRRSKRLEDKSQSEPGMDEISGRGHREKKPSEKLKEQVSTKIDKLDDEKPVVLPTYVAPNDPKFLQDQKELQKFHDHSKVAPNGDRVDFYTLGTQ